MLRKHETPNVSGLQIVRVIGLFQNPWWEGGGEDRAEPVTREGRGAAVPTEVVYSRGGEYAIEGSATQSVVLGPAGWALPKNL